MTEGEWQPSKTHKSWKHVGSATLKHTVPMSDSHTDPQTFNHHFFPYLSQFPLPLPLAVIIFYFRGIRQVQIAADTPAVGAGGGGEFISLESTRRRVKNGQMQLLFSKGFSVHSSSRYDSIFLNGGEPSPLMPGGSFPQEINSCSGRGGNH